jgi:hypothetical protein
MIGRNTMRTKLAGITLAAFLLLLAAPVWAHHSFAAEFDGNKPIKLRGTITRMEWINPHAWIHMDVKEADGSVTSWMIECGTPNTLFRHGFTRTSVSLGQEIVVDGYRAKDGTNKANGRNVTLPDGRQLFLGTGASPPEEAK